MNLNSPIYSTMLSNKFLIWGLILCISDFGRSRDQNGSGGSVYTGSLEYRTRYDLTPTGQRGKLYEKMFFTFDFHILPEHRPIGDKIFPCRCISIETAISHEVGVDPFT